MKRAVLCFFLSFPINVLAGLHGPHTHGEMEALIQWQDGQLSITLVGTAQDLIGYERTPKSAKEKKALRKFDTTYDPLEMIKTNPESGCEFIQGRTSSDMFSAMPHKHSLFGKTHTHEIGTGDHIDFLMQYTYECKSMPKITFDIFSRAPSIKKLNIHRDTIDGNVEAILTPKNNQLLVQ